MSHKTTSELCVNWTVVSNIHYNAMFNNAVKNHKREVFCYLISDQQEMKRKQQHRPKAQFSVEILNRPIHAHAYLHTCY